MPFFAAAILAGILAVAVPQGGQTEAMKQTMARLENELVAKYGAVRAARASRWGSSRPPASGAPRTGTRRPSARSCTTYIAADSTVRNALFSRMERSLESLDGHMNEIARDFRWQSDLDLGEIYPFDEVLAGYDPSAHFVDDFFRNRLAFAVLLNFPVTTLEGAARRRAPTWTRRQWAEARLAERFSKRVPGERQPRDRRGQRRGRPLHRPVQHLDAPPRRREGTRGSSRRRCGCSRTGTCATRSRPTTPTEERPRQAAR